MDPWRWEGPEIKKEPKVLLAWLRVVFRAPCCSFLDNPERKIGASENSDDSRRKKTVVPASVGAAPALPGWRDPLERKNQQDVQTDSGHRWKERWSSSPVLQCDNVLKA